MLADKYQDNSMLFFSADCGEKMGEINAELHTKGKTITRVNGDVSTFTN
jgi:hypothetical protein